MQRLFVQDDQAVEGKLNLIREDRQDIIGNIDQRRQSNNNSYYEADLTHNSRSRSNNRGVSGRDKSNDRQYQNNSDYDSQNLPPQYPNSRGI